MTRALAALLLLAACADERCPHPVPAAEVAAELRALDECLRDEGLRDDDAPPLELPADWQVCAREREQWDCGNTCCSGQADFGRRTAWVDQGHTSLRHELLHASLGLDDPTHPEPEWRCAP